MKRRFSAALVGAALVLGSLGVAQGHPCDNFPEDPRCGGTTTTTSTTTTTTTTTTLPQGGELVIPATLPYEGSLNGGEGYRFSSACINTEEVTCDTNGGSLGITSHDYFGHGMPYIYSEGVPGSHSHAWWVEGDREGYRCAYGFMYDQHPNPFGNTFNPPRDGHLIARAIIVRPDGTGYGKVNDTYMDEGMRFFDGTLTGNVGGEIQSEDCQALSLSPDFDYDAYVPHGPDDIRVGLFRADGEIGDVRDFTDSTFSNPAHFEFVSLEDGRVTIVMILGANNKVSHVFYYDVLNDGRIAVEVNGVTFQE